jgi:hypothetical protein
MHQLLSRLLQKRGIKDPQELTTEEKVDFEKWQLVLNKEELTTEDIKIFCQMQIGKIEARWADLGTENAKKAELIPFHTCYKLLLSAISSPKSAREAVEQQLNQLLQ